MHVGLGRDAMELWCGTVCGIMVGDGGVLPSGKRLVFVGKPTCSHLFRLGVIWIVCSLFEHSSLGLSCLVLPKFGF